MSPFRVRPTISLTGVNIRTSLTQVARGFAMGTADIVPGVSGGTVALVLGIYTTLIEQIHRGASAIRSLLRRDLRAAREQLLSVEWVWLGSLLVGILAAIAALSALIETLLTEQPVRTSSVFLGLVLGSVVVASKLVTSHRGRNASIAALTAIPLFLVLGLRADTHATGVEAVTRPWWVFVLSGALAICAMILPGISGSFILVMIGMYTEVIGAVNDRNIPILAATGLGCVIGLMLFSSLLNWLLQHHHDTIIAAMIGLMIGSVRVLWPWPNGTWTTTISAPSGDVLMPIVLAVVAFAVVVVIDRLSTTTASSGD